MSVNIVNEDAEEIIKRALEKLGIDVVQPWPGTDFDMTGDSGKALLGELRNSVRDIFVIQSNAETKKAHQMVLVQRTSFSNITSNGVARNRSTR